MTATLIQMVRVPFKGRDEILSLDEAKELHFAIGNAICANATDTQRIKLEVCFAFNIRLDEMNSDARPDRIAFPRQVAMWMHRTLTDMSLNTIGTRFPRENGAPRDHGTVLHAYKKVQQRISVEPTVRTRIMSLHAKLKSETEKQP